MTQTKADRLRDARKKAGYDSATDAAKAFGWTESAYRHHENGTRGFGADVAKKYGKAFKVRPAFLLGMDGEPGTLPDDVGSTSVMVNASVEAGAFRAAEGWDDRRTFIIENMPLPFSTKARFGMELVGESMSEFYESGTVLDCASIYEANIRPQNGDHVIVENRRPDGLRELTVKEYREENGRYYLVPRSLKEGYERLEYPGPDHDADSDAGVQVIGYVLAAYPPRVIDLLKRMGKIRFPHR